MATATGRTRTLTYRRFSRADSQHLDIDKELIGPRLGIERCGKIHAGNSGSESWAGIGFVTGCAAVMLIAPEPHMQQILWHWRIKYYKRESFQTRNYLSFILAPFTGIERSVTIIPPVT